MKYTYVSGDTKAVVTQVSHNPDTGAVRVTFYLMNALDATDRAIRNIVSMRQLPGTDDFVVHMHHSPLTESVGNWLKSICRTHFTSAVMSGEFFQREKTYVDTKDAEWSV